jgi:hypothetical protein
MSAGDLLLWVTEVLRVTMFGRKSVGSGLTNALSPGLPIVFLPDFPPKVVTLVTLLTSPHLGNTPR